MLLAYLLDRLSHVLYPGVSNNHKPRLLHTSTLFAISLGLALIQITILATPRIGIKILGYASNIPASSVVELTNQKRAESGLASLTVNEKLSAAAQAKGEDMLAKDYWAHVSPEGTQPWKFFGDSGYSYRYAGENLARDFSSAESAVEAWMASPSHRENLLSTKYSEIGIAVVEGDLSGVDTTIIVQLFGSPAGSTPQVPVAAAEPSTDNINSEIATVAEPTVFPTAIATPTIFLTSTPAPTNIPQEPVNINTPIIAQATKNPRVSPFSVTRTTSFLIIALVLTVMVIDAVIIRKKQIPRVGGRVFAHIAFLTMVIVIVLIAESGRIL
jgi:hypothetical protein